MKKGNKKGFTLVELLVVIAILAILATVSVVGYSSFTQKARDSRAQQELTQIHSYIYAADINDDSFAFTADGIKFTPGEGETAPADAAEAAAALKAAVGADWEFEGTFTVELDADKNVVKLIYNVDGGNATLALD